MIYSSVNLYPSGISIDATVNNTFTWTISGDAQVSYQLLIYLNSTNVIAYDSSIIVSPISSHLLPAGTLTNNNIYKFKVITFASTSQSTSKWAIFNTDANATLTIGALPTIEQVFTFTCTYNQADDIPIKTYEVELFLATDLVTPIATSDIIYPTTLVLDGGIISYEFDGLETATQYGVRFNVVTQTNYEVSTAIELFTVVYLYPQNVAGLVITPNNNEGYNELTWDVLTQKLGYVDGTYSYVAGKFNKGIQLDADSTLYYLEDLEDDFTVYFWVKLSVGYNGTLVKFGEEDEDGMAIFFNGTKFGWSHGDFITIGRPVSGVIGVWTLLAVKTRTLIIKNATYEETISI